MREDYPLVFKSIIRNIDPAKLKALKIHVVGLLVATLGVGIILVGMRTVGSIVVYFGMVIGFIGFAVNIYLFVKMLVGKRNRR